MTDFLQSQTGLNGKRILIFQQRNWGRGIGHLLAKKLQAEGCRLAAVTLKWTTYKAIIEQKEVTYDLIINNDEVMGRPKDYLAGDVSPLAEICRELGVDSIWPAVSALRNHVRSYKEKFYYGFKQNVPDEEIIDYVMAVYKYIKIIFNDFKPDLIITPTFVSLPHIMMNLYAEKHGVPMIGVTDTKIRGHYMFTYDYLDRKGPFHHRIDELDSGRQDSANRQKAKTYIAEFRQSFKHPSSTIRTEKKKPLWKKIRHWGSPFYHILKWYIKRPINLVESTGITLDYRPPRIIWRDHFSRDRYQRFIDNYDYYPLEKVGKYAYLPLQSQPEASTDVIAPFFSNQIETARLVAMSLPDDYTLVVKDHPAMMGLRAPSYLEKIARTANVKLIDYRIPSEIVLKGASLLIGPSGTTFAEAAFYNKPAIQLGDSGTIFRLPNVFKHTDMTTLNAKIREVLQADLNTPQYEHRLENFVAAVFDAAFESDYFAAWEKGEGDREVLWQIYREEIVRLLAPNNSNK